MACVWRSGVNLDEQPRYERQAALQYWSLRRMADLGRYQVARRLFQPFTLNNLTSIRW